MTAHVIVTGSIAGTIVYCSAIVKCILFWFVSTFATRHQAIVHFNHQTIPTEEGFVQHCSQTVIGTNSNLTTNATSNHFRITEYASFNPDRISNSIPNLSVNSVPHITSSPLQDSQTPAITEAPSYAIVQPKTKRSSQPLDSQGSLQDTQCSNTTAQTTEEVDFISGSSAKNVLLLPKTYETCVPSGQGEAGMQQKVEPNTVCSNEITEKAPSLKGSSSFCCKESDMQTLSQDIPRAETIKNNSFSTIIKKDKLSSQNLVEFRSKKTKPLPPLPSQQPGACTTACMSSNSHISESCTRPASDHSMLPNSHLLSLPNTPVPCICIENDSDSMASAYEVPVRSHSFSRCATEPGSAQMVARSFSFSVNQPHLKVLTSPLLVSQNVCTTNEGTEADGRGSDVTECPSQIVQFSASAISLPCPEQPSLTMV